MKTNRRTLTTTILSIFLILVVISCNTKSKDKDANPNAAYSELLMPVIDSVHSEIQNGGFGLIDRFMVIQGGEVLADYKYEQDYVTIAQQYDTTNHQFNYDHPNWHPFYNGTQLHTLQSVTKSITSILLGIAFDTYPEYTVATKAMPLFEGYSLSTEDPRKMDITIEDLLTMRSGLEWNEDDYNDAANDCIVMELRDDWIQYVLDKPTDTIPGTRFEYNSGVSVLIGKIVRIITGKRVDDFAEEKLFGPLGITEYYWKETPMGEMDTEGGLYLSSEDLAKIGTLFLNKGKWNDVQIVPESWVEVSTSPIVASVRPEMDSKIGYGYQWWIPKHTDGKSDIFAGNGFGGQFLMVAPEHDLIVLFNGWNIHDNPEKSSWRVLQDRILPALETMVP